MFQTLILPVDFSVCAENAFRYATGLKLPNVNKIVLFHSLELSRLDQLYAMVVPPAHNMKEHAEMRMEPYKSTLRDLNIPFEIVISKQKLAKALPAVVKSNLKPLIIMGTNGADGIKKLVFGTNTVRMMEKALCPVLVVPIEKRLGSFRKLAYLTDFHDTDLKNIQIIARIAETFSSVLQIVHFRDKSVGEKKGLEELRMKTERLRSYSKIEAILTGNNDPEKDLAEYVREHNPEIIALAHRHRYLPESFLSSSLARELVFSCKVPLLVFHHAPPGFIF